MQPRVIGELQVFQVNTSGNTTQTLNPLQGKFFPLMIYSISPRCCPCPGPLIEAVIYRLHTKNAARKENEQRKDTLQGCCGDVI